MALAGSEVKSGAECVELSEDNAPEGLDRIPVIAARMVRLPKAARDSAAEPHRSKNWCELPSLRPSGAVNLPGEFRKLSGEAEICVELSLPVA